MKNLILCRTMPILIFITGCDICFGQKPAAIQIDSLIARIPIPVNCQACYESCTTIKNPDGTFKIKDNGSAFNALNDEIDRLTKSDMNAMKSRYASAQASASSTPPTAEQINQMKAEAMQRAQQATQNATGPSNPAQGSNPPRPSTNVALMQELGRAQSAVGQINQLTMELSMKMGDVRMDDPPVEPNCPEVRQGSYVGPTCACEKQKDINHYQKMVDARNVYLKKVGDLLYSYVPRIRSQVALIDKVEVDSRYGEAVTDPTTIQLLGSVQRMGLNGFSSILAIASSNWTDAASQYLNVMNAGAKTCHPL